MIETQIPMDIKTLQSELGFSLKEQENFYKDILDHYEEDPYFMDQSNNEEFVSMEETLFSQNWVRVLKELNEYQKRSYKSFISQVQLFETSEEIAEFAAEKMNEIQLQLQNNKWSHLLSLKDFHRVLNIIFIGEIFQETFPLLDGKLYKWQTEINPHQRWSEDTIVRKYQEIIQEDFFTDFADLLLILSEAKLLQIFKRKLQEKIIVPSASNFYPLVFKNKEGHQFFIYCMEAYQQSDVTKTLLSKYFEFFKLDNFFLENIKPKNFFHFIQKEFEINISRLEPYTSSDKTAKDEYESLRTNFFSL